MRSHSLRPLLWLISGAAVMLILIGMTWLVAVVLTDGRPGRMWQRDDAPPAVSAVLRQIQAQQRRYFMSYGGWATNFDHLSFSPPADFNYAVCIPADCMQPAAAGAPIPVPRELSAHLAVGDCLAAVVGTVAADKIWILYKDGSIRTDGPCLGPQPQRPER